MRKKELALEVIRRLKEEYPDADCTLDYDEAWKLLVSVRLAAQCTDAVSYTHLFEFRRRILRITVGSRLWRPIVILRALRLKQIRK